MRYLEHYEFRLVREALVEREVLLKAAPHIIWPLRFVLPHHKGLRPRHLIRLGLFLYDHLGGRKILPPTRSIDLHSDVTGEPLKAEFAHAYEYSDCWVEDARLVALNARDAANRGAEIHTRTKCTSARRENGAWDITILPEGGKEQTIRAKALVNAAGPWVSEVLGSIVGRNNPDRIRMVKGSHIVVDRLYDHDRCYIFQNADGRICFAIPYEQDFTLIGTTDEDHVGEPGNPQITESETDYLLASTSEYFKLPITREQVRWTYSGIRPLYDDGASKAQEATRDYVLKLDAPGGQAPLLSVFGGILLIAAGYFPDCFIPGEGLTLFKVAGEYAVALLLVLSILYSLAYRRREARRYGYSFEISLACFIASGMAFTLYTDVYGFFNMLGHILHGYGAYILLFGFVVKSAQTLMDRHFYDLNEQIRNMNRELENRVAQRTRELEETNALLASDIARRKEAEEHLRTAKEEAEEANRAKSAFLATMSQREASRSKRPSEGTKSARRSTAFSAWRPT